MKKVTSLVKAGKKKLKGRMSKLSSGQEAVIGEVSKFDPNKANALRKGMMDSNYSTNKKIAVWGGIPPVAATGASIMASNRGQKKSEDRLIKEIRRNRQTKFEALSEVFEFADKEKKPFSRGTGAAAALAVGGIGGYQLGKRSMYNKRLKRVNQRQIAEDLKDFDKRNDKLGKRMSKLHESADKIHAKAVGERKGWQALLKKLKK